MRPKFEPAEQLWRSHDPALVQNTPSYEQSHQLLPSHIYSIYPVPVYFVNFFS